MNVESGDIWKAGPHKFSCFDIEKVDVSDVMNIPSEVHMVYSDPPWNAGNARYWRTFSKLDGEIGNKVDWGMFIDAFCKQVSSVRAFNVFVEQSKKHIDVNIKRMIANEFPAYINKWDVFYNTIHPNVLIYFSDFGHFTGDPSGMKNTAMTRHVFENIAEAGKIVFDPCVGLGMTARMAHEFDMICYGNELNPTRLKKTLEWFGKKGYAIEKVI